MTTWEYTIIDSKNIEGASRRTLASAASLHLYNPAAASIAVFAVMPALIEPSLSWLPLVPIAAVWFVLRSHGEVAQRYRDRCQC